MALSVEVVSKDELSTTYVRYGRKTCPDTAELAYEGIVGGSYFSQPGGGANLLCLPLEPEYAVEKEGVQSTLSRAWVYIAEYEIGAAPDAKYNSLHNHDVPCAVCLVKSRGTKLMIPARRSCPSSDWTKEYSGYLMADASQWSDRGGRSEFVCVDEDMEAVDGTSSNANGVILCFAVGRCSGNSGNPALPCGPYADGNELTCAVCTI